MVDPNFVFKFGKHAGKTYAWVEKNAPSYLRWAEENAPNLLKAPKPKPVAKPIAKVEVMTEQEPKSSLQNNLNFYNEGPAEISKPYLKKMADQKKLEENKQDDWPF